MCFGKNQFKVLIIFIFQQKFSWFAFKILILNNTCSYDLIIRFYESLVSKWQDEPYIALFILCLSVFLSDQTFLCRFLRKLLDNKQQEYFRRQSVVSNSSINSKNKQTNFVPFQFLLSNRNIIWLKLRVYFCTFLQ